MMRKSLRTPDWQRVPQACRHSSDAFTTFLAHGRVRGWLVASADVGSWTRSAGRVLRFAFVILSLVCGGGGRLGHTLHTYLEGQ